MFNSLFRLLTSAAARKSSGHKRCYSKPGLRFERLEARDTPAAMAFDVHHRPRGEKENIRFEVSIEDHDSNRIMKKIDKLHAITAKNLSPGNYAAIHHSAPANHGVRAIR